MPDTGRSIKQPFCSFEERKGGGLGSRTPDWQLPGNRLCGKSTGQETGNTLNFVHICPLKLRQIGDAKSLPLGKHAHACIVQNGCKDVYLCNLIIQVYGQCAAPNNALMVFNRLHAPNIFSWTLLIMAYAALGRVEDARLIFDKMPWRDGVAWNAMIAVYSRHACWKEALQLFRAMQTAGIEPSKVTMMNILMACSSQAEGKEIHSYLLRKNLCPDLLLGTSLISMYSICGCLNDSQLVFAQMLKKDVITWTSMIAACLQHDCHRKGLILFHQMELEGLMADKVTFVTILSVCANKSLLAEGKMLHAYLLFSALKLDATIGAALVTLYGRTWDLNLARQVFDRMHEQSVVSWTAMITACVQNNRDREAMELFQIMQCQGIMPDVVTYAIILNACKFAEGKRFHSFLLNEAFDFSDVDSGLVDMYARFGTLKNAQLVFNKMHERGILVWNIMISACIYNGNCKDALDLFHHIEMEGLTPDKITLATLIDACAILGALEGGKKFDNWIKDSGYNYGTDVVINTALINMYANCGNVMDAEAIFEKMATRNLISWNAIIAAFAQCGCKNKLFDFFQKMQLGGFMPDNITFINILSGCNHHGLLKDGSYIFLSMGQHYRIAPTMEHYNCIIDLLGRGGYLDEAEQLISDMPFLACTRSWTILFGSCRISWHSMETRWQSA